MVLQLQLQLPLHRHRHYLHPHPTRCYSNPNSLGYPKATSFNFPSLKIPTKTTPHCHKHKTPSILPVTVVNEETQNLQTSVGVPLVSPPPEIDPTLPTGRGLIAVVLPKIYDRLVKGKKVYEALLLIVRIILDVRLFTVIGQRTGVPVGGKLFKTLKDLAWIWGEITKKNEEEKKKAEEEGGSKDDSGEKKKDEEGDPKIDPTLPTGGLDSTFLQKVHDTLVKGKQVYEALLLILCIILDVWLFTVIGQRTEVPVGGNLLKTLKDLVWIWSEKKKAEEEGGSKHDSGEKKKDEEEEKEIN